MSMIATDICKALGGNTVLSKVSIALNPGSIHGLVGENGAGKTTLMNILAGLYRQDSGMLQLDDQPVHDKPAAKKQIAYVPSQSILFPTFKEKQTSVFYKSFFPDFDTDYFHTLTSEIGFQRKSARRLSTGMLMLVNIAVALARHPKVLLLDEPFNGLDVVVKRKMMDLLLALSEQGETAILISSHNLNDLERMIDDVTFLIRGKVTAHGDVFTVKQSCYRRYQVVFIEDAPVNLAAWPGITQVEQVGRVHTITCQGDGDTIEAKLRECGLLMLEPLGSSLEDAFIHGYQQEIQKEGVAK